MCEKKRTDNTTRDRDKVIVDRNKKRPSPDKNKSTPEFLKKEPKDK